MPIENSVQLNSSKRNFGVAAAIAIAACSLLSRDVICAILGVAAALYIGIFFYESRIEFIPGDKIARLYRKTYFSLVPSRQEIRILDQSKLVIGKSFSGIHTFRRYIKIDDGDGKNRTIYREFCEEVGFSNMVKSVSVLVGIPIEDASKADEAAAKSVPRKIIRLIRTLTFSEYWLPY